MKEIDEVIENHGGWPDAFTATSIEIAHVKDQASIEELATLSESELADSLAPMSPSLRLASLSQCSLRRRPASVRGRWRGTNMHHSRRFSKGRCARS